MLIFLSIYYAKRMITKIMKIEFYIDSYKKWWKIGFIRVCQNVHVSLFKMSLKNVIFRILCIRLLFSYV